ncbi:MAG: ABC-2 transporter permease [Oscillospiraceae bacterium]|nr:ABC-2 transporter permease [Oscillospiraceae bacterium]
MSKLRAFVKLEFITVKPYFTAKNLLLYGVMVIFLTVMSADISSGLSIGMMLATMFVGYPFVIGEKSNMDAMYTTLSVNKETVVLGRYIFTLLLNICTVLFAFAVSLISLLAAAVFGYGFQPSVNSGALFLMPALFMAMQALQLPLYFKLGYSKAKFLSIIPFAALMAGYITFTGFFGGISGLDEMLNNIFADRFSYLIVCAAFAAIVLVSYRLSLVFYKKREF